MDNRKNIVILAIETSCDETAAAVLSLADDKKLVHRSLGEGGWPKIKTLSSVVKSQIKLHSKMGGVVPEAAARAHVKYIRPVVEEALSNVNCQMSNVDYIAVTQGPGLIPSLIVGVEFAKGLAFALKKPIIPVNHMLGHLYSPLVSRMTLDMFPLVSLIVSGGHTMLVLMPARGGSASGGKNIKEYKVLGQTVDDAAGEAFDKVAKLLGLPYPGGPEVSKLAADGNPSAINFPRPMMNAKNYNFSFSGLKTAVLYYVQSLQPTNYNLQAKKDICAGFQQAAVDVLVTKTMRAVKEFKAKSVSLSGGVAANARLRQQLIVNCSSFAKASADKQKLNVKFFVPPKNLCTDNAEMIGLAAAFMLHNGYKPKSYKQIKADPNLQL